MKNKQKQICTISSARQRTYKDRVIPNGFNVFVESNSGKVIDRWFNENEVYALPFRSKVWNKLKRASVKLDIEALRTIFGEEPEIKYSHKAGCRCGCSPGYTVRKSFKTNKDYQNKDIWAVISHPGVEDLQKTLKETTVALIEEIKQYENA